MLFNFNFNVVFLLDAFFLIFEKLTQIVIISNSEKLNS